MIVADIMSRDIVTVSTQTSLSEAARLMVKRHISGVPVLDDHSRLVGILTEGDVLRRPELGTGGRQAGWLRGLMKASTLAAAYAHTHSRFVGDIMTRNPVFVRQEMPLQKATELMITKRVKRLPVLQDERLIGMLTRFDLLTALSARLTDHNGEASDTDISTSIQTALAREPWAPKSGVRYLVKAGRVQLEGNVFSEEESRALRVLVENTAGVTLVVNLLNISEAALPHGVHAERFF